MFKNKFVLGIIVLGIVASMFYMYGSAPTYAEKANQANEDYKKSLMSMEDSPVAKVGTQAISFFEPDEKWSFEADFIKTDSERFFSLEMTDSSSSKSKLAGYATLRIDGVAYNLLVFDEGANFLIPFKDKTNGNQTYGGGRYINIEKSQLVAKKLTVDFNKAHNFYCAYDEKFICPVPPKENNINAEILAGEKNFPRQSTH